MDTQLYPVVPSYYSNGRYHVRKEPTPVAMGDDVYQNRVRRAYFQGWNAVADYDKQEFLRRHPNARGKQGEEMDEFLRNQIFEDVFKNSEDKQDQQIWNNFAAGKYTVGDRDSILAQKAEFSDIDGLSAIKEQSYTPFDFMFEAAMPDIPKYRRKNYAKSITTLRDQARDYVNRKASSLTPMFLLRINELSPEEYNQQLNEFSKYAESVSPYYKEYKNSGKIDKSSGALAERYAQYLANSQVAGAQFAAAALNRSFQDEAASNLGFFEKLSNAGGVFLDSMGSMLVRIAGMTAGGSAALFGYGREKDEGYWENFGEMFIDNKITQYGDRIATTGEWFDINRQKLLEARGLSNHQILNTVEQQNSILTWNTPFELVGQYGFTVASTILSGGGSWLLKGLTKGASKLARLATAGRGAKAAAAGLKFIEGIKKSLDVANIFVAGSVGMVEGGMNAASTKKETMKDFSAKIAEKYGLLGAVQLLSQTEQFEGAEPEEILAEASKTLSPEQRENLNADLKAALEAADVAMYQDFTVNSVINGLIHSTFKATLQAPRIQRALERHGLKKSPLSKSQRIVKDLAGNWTSEYIKETTADIIKDRVKESFGEGLEEYIQDASSTFASAYGADKFQQYLNNKYSTGKVADAVENDVWQSLGAGLDALNSNLLSPESIKSFIYGGLSTLLGGFNVNFNAKWGKKAEGENTFEYLSRLSPITWRGAWTPLINHTEREQINRLREQEAKRINDFFADKTVQNALFNVEGTSNFIYEMTEALKGGDEKGARDARLGAMISSIMTVNELRDSGYYETLMASLSARANFKIANLQDPNSAESKAVDMYLAAPENQGLTMSKEEALSEIQSSSKKMIEMIGRVENETRAVNKLFGDTLDNDVKSAMVYNRISILDDAKRIDLLTGEINKAKEALRNDSLLVADSNLDAKSKKLIARYGSLSNATKKIEELKSRLNEVKELQVELTRIVNDKDASPLERHQALLMLNTMQLHGTMLQEIVNDVEEVKSSYEMQAATNVEGQESTIEEAKVISAQEIIDMDSRDRAFMLDSKNRQLYSAEQQAEIDKVNSVGTLVDSDFTRKISDVARLENSYQKSLISLYNYMMNSDSLNRYAYTVKKEVEIRAYAKKNEFLLDYENKGDYASFARELEKILNTENQEEIASVKFLLRGSRFYERFLNENDKKRELRNYIDKNDSINMTSEQAGLFSVILDFLSANNVNITDVDAAVNLLSLTQTEEVKDNLGNITGTKETSPLLEYIDEVNKSLPDDKKITLGNLLDAILMVKDVVGVYNKDMEERAKSQKVADPASSINPALTNPTLTPPAVPTAPTDNPPTAPLGGSSLGTSPLGTAEEYEDPIVNNVALHNSTNEEVIKEAEFVVNRVKSLESKYGQEATLLALQHIGDISSEEYSNTESFDLALLSLENKLLASSSDDTSVEAKASTILRMAREAHGVYARKRKDTTEQRARNSKATSTRSLFNNTGSQKFIDKLTPEERQELESRLLAILNNRGSISNWISPSRDPVIAEYFANASIVKSIDTSSWSRLNFINPLQQYLESMGITKYLATHSVEELKLKKVYFYSPNIENNQQTNRDYDPTIDDALVAIVEDENGKIVIGDKKYQPIGLMPKSYDGIHDRPYHASSIQGTASLLPVRLNMLNVPKGTIITDLSGNPINTRITSFVFGSTVNTLLQGYHSFAQLSLEKMSAAERQLALGMSMLQIRNSKGYKRAKQQFLGTFLYRGSITNCYVRQFDAKGNPILGTSGLAPIHFINAGEAFGGTIARNSKKTLKQVITEVFSNSDNSSQLYDSSNPEEGGFNKRILNIGKGLQEFFLNTFNVSELASITDEQDLIRKLNEGADSYAKKLKRIFINKNGIYFKESEYRFIFTPSNNIGNRPGYTLNLKDEKSGKLVPLTEVTLGLLSDKTAAKIIGNMFMEGGQMRTGIRWQIDNDMLKVFENPDKVPPEKIAKSKEYLEDLYDDNLVQTTKNVLLKEIKQIAFQAPYNREGLLINPEPVIPTVTVSNPDNANINSNKPGTITTAEGKEIIPETGTHVDGSKPETKTDNVINQAVKLAESIAETITEESENWHLTEDETGYVHKDNPSAVHIRVTSAIVADEENTIDPKTELPERFDPTSPWKLPSTTIGTAVDEFIRDFFDGKFSDTDTFENRPNATKELWLYLYQQLKTFKEGYCNNHGLHIVPRNVIAHGQLSVRDKNGRKGKVNVAGTLDLLAYDNDGNFYIFDMKTYRSELESKKKKYARQVSVYQKLLLQYLASLGINIKINKLAIIPIKVSYPHVNDVDYQKTDNNQLLVGTKGSNSFVKLKTVTMDLAKEPIDCDYHEPDIIFERLLDYEKALVKWDDEVNNPPAAPAAPVSITATETPGDTKTKLEKDNTELPTAAQDTSSTETSTETSPLPPQPLRRRVGVRRRGNVDLGFGLTDKELGRGHQGAINPKYSLPWLKENNPKGYKFVQNYNAKMQDNTAWDKMPDKMKESLLSCLLEEEKN